MAEDFCISLTSQSTFDNETLSIFHHWCSGKSPQETYGMISVQDIFKGVDEEFALEFPFLRYRISKDIAGTATGLGGLGGQGYQYQQQRGGYEKFLSQQSFAAFPVRRVPTSTSASTSPSVIVPVAANAEPANVEPGVAGSGKGGLGEGSVSESNACDATETTSLTPPYVNDVPVPPVPVSIPPPIHVCALTKSQKCTLEEEDILAHYRNFRALEAYLCNPSLLASQTLVPVPADKQANLIDNYWHLDDVVVRSLMGNKRGMSISRKDLDDVSSNTTIALRSVMRQFSNLKRVYSEVDEYDGDFNLYKYIASTYLLSPMLTHKYCCIVFLFYAKFILNGESLSLRERRLTCDILEKCAALILTCLCARQEVFYRMWYLAEQGEETKRRQTLEEAAREVELESQQDGQRHNDYDSITTAGRDKDGKAEQRSAVSFSLLPSALERINTAGSTVSITSSVSSNEYLPPPPISHLYSLGSEGSGPYTGGGAGAGVDDTSNINTSISMRDDMGNGTYVEGSVGAGEGGVNAYVSPVILAPSVSGSSTSSKDTLTNNNSMEQGVSGLNVAQTNTNNSNHSSVRDSSSISDSNRENIPINIDLEKYIPDTIINGNEKLCWICIKSIFKNVNAVDPDKDLLISLRDIRMHFTGDALGRGVNAIRKALQAYISQGSKILVKFDESKMRSVCKYLLLIGANLSQSREYRAIFEDMLAKVAEPLLHDVGLNREQIGIFLLCSSHLTDALPDPAVARTAATVRKLNLIRRKDWLRFVLCTRLVVDHLLC